MDPVVRKGYARFDAVVVLAVLVFVVLWVVFGASRWIAAAVCAGALLVVGVLLGAREASRRTCPRHGLPLVLREVSIAYGLVRFPLGWFHEERTRFPFGGEPPRGGCTLPEEPELVTIKVCAQCESIRITRQREVGLG